MAEKRLVIVTGGLGSGKTSLVSGLEKHGFESRKIGDELARLYRVKHGLPQEFTVPGLERMKTHKEIRQTDPEYFSRFSYEEPYERRVIDGLRNMSDAKRCVERGATVIALVAPRAVRFMRRLSDTAKDPSLDAMVQRELQELDDPDPHGAQTLRVMALAGEHGFFVDATNSPEVILDEVVQKLGLE